MTTDPITVTLNHLEAVARAATPGPWSCDDGNVFSKPIADAEYAKRAARRLAGLKNEPRNGNPAFITGGQGNDNFDADSEFIAALNPERALQLIEVVRLARRLLNAIQKTYGEPAMGVYREKLDAEQALGIALEKIGAPHG